jgi:sugar lactone lactonase YvrE
MKKRYSKRSLILSFIIVLLYCSNTCFAQLSQIVSEFSVYSPPSPNATALLRYANVPVDEHTGIPSVVLPIDQLSGRQLTVPITLSYHGSGNKVQDIASNVGLGFVLNAGGVITRVMRGLPDESSTGYQYKGNIINSSNVDSVYLNAVINSKIDAEPDMFYFNFLGHTGKLVVDTNGNAQYLPDQGIRVISHPIHNNRDSTQNAWVLKDLNGTTYIFGADTSSKEVTVVNLAGKPVTQAITYISSWYLAKVITPDGKETVNFTYSSGPSLNYEQYRNVTTYIIQDNNTDKRKGIFSSKVQHTDSYSAIDVKKNDVSTIIQVLSPKYLSSIKNDMGSVTFSYSSRLDLAGGQALNQINIYNIYDSSTPLKTYTFNESYFLSPNPVNPTDPDSKRLRLDCVNLQGRSAETKQLFVFSYNEQTLLPPRSSDEFDHWGYYTTLDDRAGYPPVNLTPDIYGNYDDGFERRAPDSTRVMACILTKVRNVNGGYTNFFYAMDDYKYNGNGYTGGGLRIKTIVENDSLGQVVPLIKQYDYKLDDGTSSGMIYNAKPYYIQGIPNWQVGTVVKPIPSLLSYEVNNLKKPLTIVSTAVEVGLTIAGAVSVAGLAVDVAVIVLAPAVADAYQFLFHRTHHYTTFSPPFSISSTPLNNLFDINGASVTYSEVQVLNADGGRTVDYYTSQQEYPDSSSAVELNCLAQPVKPVYENTGSYPPSTSFDFERGLLKQSKSYDNYNNLVSMVTNTYQLSKRVGVVYGQSPSVTGYAPLPNGAFQVVTYDVGIYKEIAENIQLVKSITQLYDQTNNGNSITSTHTYTWQPVYPTLLHSESTNRSDGKLLTNYISYPMEYASGTTFLDNMVSHYQLAMPIERVSTLQDSTGLSITGGGINRYKTGGAGLLDSVFSVAASKPIPLANFKFSNQVLGFMNGSYGAYRADKSYVAKAFYQLYDNKNNLIQSQNIGEPSSSIIWGYNQDVPIAQISNATINKVAYTSFETNDQQYWSFTATGRDSSGLAKTGKIRYQLSSGAVSTTASIPAGTYILSLWTQGTKPTISGTTGDVSIVNGESDNHLWSFYMDRITVAGGTQLTLTGSGLIDELRLYPQGAHMSTVSITPQVGTSSVNSQDDKVNTYEYDALVRAATVRDDQYNILKQFSYSNVPQVPCVDIPDTWIGINPVCYTDQTNILPNVNNYSAVAVNSYGNILCDFTRTSTESNYLAQLNYTAKFTDSTTYSSSILIKSGDLSTIMGLPLTGKSAESVMNVGIDTVINLSNDYGVAYQSFQNRQRVRDGYTEVNTLTGGIGPFIAPVRNATACGNLFTNTTQTGFYKNDCANGNGSVVDYTVAAGLFSASSQYKADSIARASGQVYANANGNCTSIDTSFVGTNPYCITDTAFSGTPTLSSYSIATNNIPQISMLNATITRSSAETAHDAIVSYQMQFNDGSTVTYTAPMYKSQSTINFSPPLIGYGPASVIGISITGVTYAALTRLAYADRARLQNGVLDGYQEANTPGQYYLAPLASAGACQTWYYNTAQTGFYRNNCANGQLGSSVSYTVPARTDSSTVSQAYADALARARGQAYVNTVGSCAVEPYVSTYAGNGQATNIDGNASSAAFQGIFNVACDNSGNVYVDETFEIRKITPSGIVSTFVSPSAGLSGIFGMITDAAGNVYVCDQNNAKVRKITPAGAISTLAGGGFGYTDGQGTAAKFSGSLEGIGVDPNGNIYVGDNGNNRIRKITPGGVVTTFAGNGTAGYIDGPVSTAEFNGILAITIDKTGVMYVYEYYNNRIRKISNGIVSTIAGGAASFQDGTGSTAGLSTCSQMTTDAAGNIYLADINNSCIRKVTPSGVVTTITNTKSYGIGGTNGPLTIATFNHPIGIAIDAAGNLYIGTADGGIGSSVIRKITFPQQ